MSKDTNDLEYLRKYNKNWVCLDSRGTVLSVSKDVVQCCQDAEKRDKEYSLQYVDLEEKTIVK